MSNKNDIINTHVDALEAVYLAHTEDGHTSARGTDLLIGIVQTIQGEDRETVLNRFQARVGGED